MHQIRAQEMGRGADMGKTHTKPLRNLGNGVLGAVALYLCLAISPLPAQTANSGDFSPVKFVNNQAITGYELAQRMAFLKVLGVSEDVEDQAIAGLIDDRLRLSAAKAMGISLSPEALRSGMEEFAARGSLNADEFMRAIGQEGIAPETFRDFISAGLVWRDVVRTRFDSKVVISDAAIDRALTNLTIPEAQTVTYSEIVLDAAGAQRNKALALARDLQIDFIKGREFAAAAQAVSVGQTARNGGALPPKLLSELPDEIAVLVRALSVGQISKPILIGDRVYLFQLLESGTKPLAEIPANYVDYAEITLPSQGDSAAHLADLRRQIDTCDDLYAYATAARGMAVQRRTGGAGDVAGLLQMLDAGEMAGPVMRAGAPTALMLCARGLNPTQTASRDEVRIILKNQRLAALADVYLSELRADALIRDP